MYDVVTFGEAMIRLSSPEYRRLENATKLDVEVGGGEYNVAVGCAHLGLKTAWVSRLVDNWTGRLIRNKGREHRVDMSHIIWVPFDGVGLERNGFYHLEVGVGPRASAVTYDRGHSAISKVEPGMIDWKALFDETRWFHVSGITPALSESAAATTLEALKAANQVGVTTSYDLNFRSKLWSPEQAQETTKQFMPLVKVLLGNEEDFDKVLGLKAEGTTEDYSALDPESYKEVARRVVEQYPNVEYVGTTLRVAKTGLLNDWRTLLFDGKEFYLCRIYEDMEIVDRVGGGDSFSAGLIVSLLEDKDLQTAVDFAGAYSALAHTFPGDVNWATRAETEAATKSGAARIRR
ncbi:MAG: PfkB family carbohydrate kinase [Candidatus Bipolaricaulia bacterium]